MLAGGSIAESTPYGFKSEKRNALFELGHILAPETHRSSQDTALNFLKSIGKQFNCTIGEFSIAWALKNKNVCSALMGWKKSLEINEALNALNLREKIDEKIEEELNRAFQNQPKTKYNWKTNEMDKNERF